MRRYVTATCAAIVATASAAWTAPPIDPATCKPLGNLMRLDGLSEASGLAASRATPGRLWAHNDSGTPEIIAFDVRGNITGRVTITGARVEDWESMAAAPCGSGTCLYIGDIGDNEARRKEITIYRIAEPAAPSGTAKIESVIRASYPDGAHDAEALLATPDGTLYVVTKGDTGHVALYRVPSDRTTPVTLERVGAPITKGMPPANARITDGAISPDGKWVVLRTRGALTFYPGGEFRKGNFTPSRQIDVTSLREPQGEAVAFGPANAVYIAGEGGSKNQPGTLAALSCAN